MGSCLGKCLSSPKKNSNSCTDIEFVEYAPSIECQVVKKRLHPRCARVFIQWHLWWFTLNTEERCNVGIRLGLVSADFRVHFQEFNNGRDGPSINFATGTLLLYCHLSNQFGMDLDSHCIFLGSTRVVEIRHRIISYESTSMSTFTTLVILGISRTASVTILTDSVMPAFASPKDFRRFSLAARKHFFCNLNFICPQDWEEDVDVSLAWLYILLTMLKHKLATISCPPKLLRFLEGPTFLRVKLLEDFHYGKEYLQPLTKIKTRILSFSHFDQIATLYYNYDFVQSSVRVVEWGYWGSKPFSLPMADVYPKLKEWWPNLGVFEITMTEFMMKRFDDAMPESESTVFERKLRQMKALMDQVMSAAIKTKVMTSLNVNFILPVYKFDENIERIEEYLDIDLSDNLQVEFVDDHVTINVDVHDLIEYSLLSAAAH